MGFELDMEEAGKRLEAGLSKAFGEFFSQYPSGTVKEVDLVTSESVCVYIEADDGTSQTWLISFKVGESLEFTQVG